MSLFQFQQAKDKLEIIFNIYTNLKHVWEQLF